MEPVYYYNQEGECFIFKQVADSHCQLHGDYIATYVQGTKIRTSGKPSNAVYSTEVGKLHPHSKSYLEHKKII